MDVRYLVHKIKCMASRQESRDLKRVVISPLVYFILYKHIRKVFKLGKYMITYYFLYKTLYISYQNQVYLFESVFDDIRWISKRFNTVKCKSNYAVFQRPFQMKNIKKGKHFKYSWMMSCPVVTYCEFRTQRVMRENAWSWMRGFSHGISLQNRP